MSLAPGAKLGPYEILSALGAGGMLSRFAGVSPPQRTGTRRRNPPQADWSGSLEFGRFGRTSATRPPQAEERLGC